MINKLISELNIFYHFYIIKILTIHVNPPRTKTICSAWFSLTVLKAPEVQIHLSFCNFFLKYIFLIFYFVQCRFNCLTIFAPFLQETAKFPLNLKLSDVLNISNHFEIWSFHFLMAPCDSGEAPAMPPDPATPPLVPPSVPLQDKD